MPTSDGELTLPVIGRATEQGPTRPRNADDAETYLLHGRLAAAVVDGTGSSLEVAQFARHAAYHSARVAARHSPTHGILSVTEATADPRSELTSPDGAIVVALIEADEPWRVAWVGDCAAYAWNGTTVTRLTTPHTLGERMRAAGADEADAREHDNKVLHSIGRATISTVDTKAAYAKAMVLCSDGLRLDPERIAEVLTRHADDLDACATALVATARADGSTDDITVLVVPDPFAQDDNA